MITQQKDSIKIIGASVIGPLHLKSVTPCQDAFAYETLPSGTGIIAIADGLGSASLSDFGAREAVNMAVKTVRHLISDNSSGEQSLQAIAKEAVFSARKVLEEKSIEYQCKMRDLACTLIVVVIYNDTISVAHIGDGAVVAKVNDTLKLISGPGNSEYANEVTPLTGKEWENYLRVIQPVSGVSGVMAFTDGMQRAALKKTPPEGVIPFDRFCEPLFSYANEVADLREAEKDIKALLSSKKICDNSEDDKTLVIAVIKDYVEITP